MKSKEENMLFMLQNAIGGETFEECINWVKNMRLKSVFDRENSGTEPCQCNYHPYWQAVLRLKSLPIPHPTQEEIEFCVNHSHDKKVTIQTADTVIRSFVHMRNNPKEKDPRIKVVQIWLAEEPAGGPNSSYVDAEELLRRLDELCAEAKQ